MNSFYSSSSSLKQLMAVIISILSIVVVFTIGAFLIKVLFYLAPFALIGWGGYKAYKGITTYFARKSSIEHGSASFSGTVEMVTSEEIIKNAIENDAVIDVDFKEV
jgi:hypothetical protein